MMTRRKFLRFWKGTAAPPAATGSADGGAAQDADALRRAYLQAMGAGVDPATLAPEELVRRFSSEVTSNDAADG
ncbi:hypothetical protein [Oleidesulfovibrio alaskensis]